MFRLFLGNQALKTELSARLAAQTLPHAVCICGAQGTGGGYFALLLAAAYLQDETGLALRGAHPDLIAVQGSGASGSIAVDDVRDALYEMNKASVMANGRRVLLVRRAEHLNMNSANALLKMMEEPPAGVLFLLTARNEEDLLPTLRSRATFYRVQPLDTALCAEETMRRVPACDAARARRLSELYGGRLGLVLRALSDTQFAAMGDAAEKFCNAVLAADRYGAMVQLGCAADRNELIMLLEAAHTCLGAKLRRQPQDAQRFAGLSALITETIYAVKQYTNVKLAATQLAVQATKRGK